MVWDRWLISGCLNPTVMKLPRSPIYYETPGKTLEGTRDPSAFYNPYSVLKNQQRSLLRVPPQVPGIWKAATEGETEQVLSWQKVGSFGWVQLRLGAGRR